MTVATISNKSKPRTNIEKLLAVYRSEPVLHQKILQIKALLFFMERKGDFINGLSRGTLRGMDGRKFTSSNLNPILDRLHEKKLLTENFNCNPVILHEITTDAISPHNTEATANLVELGHFFNYKQDYEVERMDSLNNIRIIHIAAHLNNPHVFLNANNFKPDNCDIFIHNLISVFYQYSLDPEWISSRHPVIQLYLLCAKLYGFHATARFKTMDYFYSAK